MKHFDNLHKMRGIMSMFIVMYHYGAWLELDFVNLIFKAYGRYAVSIF